MSNNKPKRQLKGIWIPITVWKGENMTISEKIVLAEISNFEKAKGCFVSNSYLGKLVDLSSGRISQIISKLKDLNYISVEYIYREGKKEVEKRIIKINKNKFYEIIDDEDDEDL